MNIDIFEDIPQDISEKIKKANVFFQKEYVDYVRSNKEEVYFVYDDERITPLRYRKKFIFKLAYFLSEPYELGTNSTKGLKQYLNDVITIIDKELGIQWCNSTASCLFIETPTKNCKRIPFGSHILDLSLDEKALFNKIHSKHRNVIRRAERAGVVVKCGGIELLKDYVKLESETSKRTGHSTSGYAYYEKQIKMLKKCVSLYIAYNEGNPVAGGIFYHNQACCYYMYGAASLSPVIGAANLLIWHAMKDMKEKGVQLISFVGCRINEDLESKYHGIQRFKARFGGDLKVGYMFRCEKNVVLYKLFCLAMQIKLRSWKKYTTPIDEEIGKWLNIQEDEKW